RNPRVAVSASFNPVAHMNAKLSALSFVGVATVFVSAAGLRAQAVVPVADSPGIAGEERTVLSPFVISDNRDSGYQATSTLAGTRLNTPIKDLAASISIYTKDFIEDIGATNSADLLIFATGMEAAGE